MTKLLLLFLSVALTNAFSISHGKGGYEGPGKVFPPNARELPTMPNIEYAMRGYNLLMGNPLATGHQADPGFDSSIFEAVYSGAATADLRYQIPDGMSVYSKTICNIQFLSDVYTNEKKYQHELKVPVNVDFSGWGAAFTANVQYQQTTTQMSTYEHSFVKTESTCGVYEVVLDLYEPAKLRSGFLTAAQTLQDANAEDEYTTYRRFVEVYGSHFLASTHMGAKYAEQSELSKTSRETLEAENIDIKLAAAYSALFKLGIDGGANIDTETMERFQKETLSQSIISFGSRPPADGSASTWANSVFDEPLPISYHLLPIDELFTASFMADSGIDYALIRPRLRSFIKGYCESEQDNLGISDCNGPRGGCAGGHDCHHNAHCVDTEETDVYSCVCNEGYYGNGFSCSGWNIQHVLHPDVNGQWGDWGDVDMCPNGTFATTFALKVMDETSWVEDDSALNGVKLYCQSQDGKRTGEASSSVGHHGSWKDPLTCAHGFLTGFRFRSSSDIVGDDVMGTNMDGTCQGGQILDGQGVNSWGAWSSWAYCPPEAAICGLQTKVHPFQGDLAWEDDVGLTDIKIICCQM